MGSGSGLFRCLTAFPAARKRVRHPSGARPFCCSLTRRVRELRPGERLLLASGQEATVKAARCEAAARDGLGRALQTPVYNFQVKGWHSYFAAPNEGATLGEFAWVHNAKNYRVIGATSSGRPINSKGQRIGPSGKTMVHQKNFPTRKAGKDAARNAGKGPPMQHKSPKRGGPHFHPVDAKGKKIEEGVHYNYPAKPGKKRES